MATDFEADLYRDDRSPARRDGAPAGGVELGAVEAPELTREQEYATAHNDFLGREITFLRPNEVSFTLFQQDMNSGMLSQAEKLGIAGDYFRGLMGEEGFRAYHAKVNQEARRLGPKAAARFFEVLAYMTEFFHEYMLEQDEDAVNQVQNRAKRRAAERAKRRAEEKGRGSR